MTINDDIFVDVGIVITVKKIEKGVSSTKGLEITLTNNKIKNIMKLTKSLENRGILIKETTTKITSQEGRFLNYLRALMTAGLPLMKRVLIKLLKVS